MIIGNPFEILYRCESKRYGPNQNLGTRPILLANRSEEADRHKDGAGNEQEAIQALKPSPTPVRFNVVDSKGLFSVRH